MSVSNGATSQKPSLQEVLDRVALVVCQTRVVSPLRDTGEGREEGARIEKVLQKCFNPKALRPVHRLKAESGRLCRTYGSRVETLNAWAVPTERVEELMESLADVARQWNDATNELAINMEDQVNQWADENPSHAQAIRSLAPSAEEVRGSTRFIYSAYRLRGEDVTDPGCLEMELNDLSGQALHEFAVAIRDAGVNRNTRGSYSGAICELLSKISVKAQSLAFLSPVLAEVSVAIDDVLKTLPVSGAISGIHGIAITGLIDSLLQPAKLLRDGFPKVEDVTPKSSETDQSEEEVEDRPMVIASLGEVDISAALAW